MAMPSPANSTKPVRGLNVVANSVYSFIEQNKRAGPCFGDFIAVIRSAKPQLNGHPPSEQISFMRERPFTRIADLAEWHFAPIDSEIK